MIGLVLVSHSAKLAEGLKDLVSQMEPDLPVRAAGGAVDGSLGTNAEAIHQAIVELDNPDGVLVLLDLGSAAMSTEIALEWLDDAQRRHVIVSDAPFVEGAVLAATSARQRQSLTAVAAAARQARQFPKLATNDAAVEGRAQVAPEERAASGSAPGPAEETAVLTNAAGLHARSAAQLVKTGAGFAAKISIARGEQRADARSLSALLRLGARRGDMLRIQAEGERAQEAVLAIKALIEGGFGEA